jgi:hypothetical protein
MVVLTLPRVRGRVGWGRDTVGLDMNDWFEALGRRFAEAAKARGADIATPELDPMVADEVLELARVSAHTKERRFAPLACFMAGVAVERLRQAGSLSAAEETAYLRAIREGLDEAPTLPSPASGGGD